jgi:hypothetical protein
MLPAHDLPPDAQKDGPSSSHDPFIKGQLASRNQLQGLIWCTFGHAPRRFQEQRPSGPLGPYETLGTPPCGQEDFRDFIAAVSVPDFLNKLCGMILNRPDLNPDSEFYSTRGLSEVVSSIGQTLDCLLSLPPPCGPTVLPTTGSGDYSLPGYSRNPFEVCSQCIGVERISREMKPFPASKYVSNQMHQLPVEISRLKEPGTVPGTHHGDLGRSEPLPRPSGAVRAYRGQHLRRDCTAGVHLECTSLHCWLSLSLSRALSLSLHVLSLSLCLSHVHVDFQSGATLMFFWSYRPNQ